MTRITFAHPTNPRIRKKAHRGNAQRFLNAGWTLVDPETDETDLDRIFNIAETGATDVLDIPEGNIASILDWVDENPIRAKFARDVEQSLPKPRSTLIDRLESIAAGDTDNTPQGEEE